MRVRTIALVLAGMVATQGCATRRGNLIVMGVGVGVAAIAVATPAVIRAQESSNEHSGGPSLLIVGSVLLGSAGLMTAVAGGLGWLVVRSRGLRAEPSPAIAPEATPPAAPTLERVLLQAQVHAGNGDCARARRQARLIAARSPDFYRTRVETDPIVAPCLAPTPTP